MSNQISKRNGHRMCLAMDHVAEGAERFTVLFRKGE